MAKKNQDAGGEMQFAPAIPAARGQYEKDNRAHGKHQPNQPFGEHGEGDHGRAAPISGARGNLAIPRAKKQIQRERKLQRNHGFRNHDSRKEKRAEAGAYRQAGIETGARAKIPPAEREDGEDKRDDQESQRNTSGEGAAAEQRVRGRHCPILQWRFLQVAEAVHVQNGPVVPLKHRGGHAGVRGVRVIEERGRGSAADIDSGAQQGKEDQAELLRGPAPQCGESALIPVRPRSAGRRLRLRKGHRRKS
jgi:hypothetical protein